MTENMQGVSAPARPYTRWQRGLAAAPVAVASAALVVACGGGDGTSPSGSSLSSSETPTATAQAVATNSGTVPSGWKGRVPTGWAATTTQGSASSLASGISLKVAYPGRLVATAPSDSSLLDLAPNLTPSATQPPDGSLSLSFQIDQNLAKLSLQEYYDGDPGTPLGATVGTVSVSGRVGYLFVPQITEAGDTVVVVPLTGDRFLRITDRGQSLQQSGEFVKILSYIQLEAN